MFGLREFKQEAESWSTAKKDLAKSIIDNYEQNTYAEDSDFHIYITLKNTLYHLNDYEIQQICVDAIRNHNLGYTELATISLMAARNKNLVQALEYAEKIIRTHLHGEREIADLTHSLISAYLSEEIEPKQNIDGRRIIDEAMLLQNVCQLISKCEPSISKEVEKEKGMESDCHKETAAPKAVHHLEESIIEFTNRIKDLAYKSCKINNARKSCQSKEVKHFEFNDLSFVVNKDRSTDYHIRESSDKLRRLSLFTPKAARLIIDCGAHVGMFSALAAKNAVEPEIILFEPDCDLHNMIRQNMKHCSNYCLYGCAVGGAHGKASFFKSKQSSQTSSISAKTVEPFSNIDGIEERSISVNKLSDLIGTNKTIDYLKIDVQGSELSIVEDLINHNILKNVNILAIESSFLDMKSIDCIKIIKREGIFESAYLVNTVYGGGDIVCSNIKEHEQTAIEIGAQKVF